MAPPPTAEKDLTDRVKALEDELTRLRGLIASLVKRFDPDQDDDLIDEIADKPMSEQEMEAAFARLDAEADRTR